MPDIELRFNRDMLVLSAPIDATLRRQGIDVGRDRQYMNLIEPDAVRDALRLEATAGAQCIVTPTEDITAARLAHVNMGGDSPRLAQAALGIAAELRPQHVLAEIGPCGLPLDAASKASLNENRAQYADAARAFGEAAFDAFFLNGFTRLSDLKCALMGVAQASDKPVFASVTIGREGAASGPVAVRTEGAGASESDALQSVVESYPLAAGGFSVVDELPSPPVPSAGRTVLDPSEWPEAVGMMAEFGAAVIGFETAEPVANAVEYARIAAERTPLPVLAQLRVSGLPADTAVAKGLTPVQDIDAYTPDTMELAAVKLYASGVQFLRATGEATPACTGALAATVQGLDVRR